MNHLTEQPGSFETDIEQFAETLNSWVTTDDALQELVELIYQQVGWLIARSMRWSSGSFLEAQGWQPLLGGGQVHGHLPARSLTLDGSRELLSLCCRKLLSVGTQGWSQTAHSPVWPGL